ncbi:SDR family NAD(P)-dependent oxidoreductase [Flagellimonas sp. DF-77]|uniref:SDR family NAD(P)-dependent oxidoreductase n=1 Tax=Flagellimonas algarum TaxID=3230298 RepID=UPI0033929733
MKKNILITGSTDGIGKMAAMKLAKAGHHLFLHGRNPEKLEATIADIRKEANTREVYGAVADFSDLDVVARLAKKTDFELDRLDVLINNAGVFHSHERTNMEGLDLRFTVNYLAPYLLTRSLLPLLRKTALARVVNLSSAAQAPVDMHALEGKNTLSTNEAYAQSKLALTMWSMDLAQKEHSIRVTAVNPGSLLNTKMVQEAYGQHWSPASKGADLLYDLAVSSEFTNETGGYFDNDSGDPRGQFGKAHTDAYDPTKIDRLLQTTERILGPRIQ